MNEGFEADFAIISRSACDAVAETSKGNSVGADLRNVEKEIWNSLPNPRWVEDLAVDSLSQAAGDEIVSIFEIVKNGRDATILVKTHDKLGCIPKDAFPSPQAAAAELFGLPDGNLSRYKEVYPSQRALSDQVATLIIEPGSGRLITVKVEDPGCGVHPRDIGRTFLSTAVSDKRDYPYLAAGFGLGGLFITRHARGGQMIVTKLDTAMNDGQEAPWGVLLLKTEVRVSPDGQQRIYFKYLCGERDGQVVFPAMPPDTVVAVRKNTDVVDISDGQCLDDRLQDRRDVYETEHPDETILDFTIRDAAPTRKTKTTKRRAVCTVTTAMRRGTLRICAECEFSSKWAQYNIGENTKDVYTPGLFEAMRRVEPEPTIPFSIVDMRWGSDQAGDSRLEGSTEVRSRMVKTTRVTMAGVAQILDKAVNKGVAERIDMSLPVAMDDGAPLGEVSLTVWHGRKLADEEGAPQILLNPERSPFHVLFHGHAIGRLSRDDAIDIVGIPGIVNRFVFFLRLEGTNCHSAVRDNGRKLKPNTRETLAIMKAVKKFARDHQRIAEIRLESRQSIDSATQAQKISDLLARANDDGSAGSIIEVGKIKACVRSGSGDKLKRQDAKPKTAVFKKKASYKGGSSWENLMPTKVPRGSTQGAAIETSSREPVRWERLNTKNAKSKRRRGRKRHARGYRIKTLVVGDNPDVSARWRGGNTIEVEVGPEAPAIDVAVLAFVTNGSFKSKPAVFKVRPVDPPDTMVMGHEPTRLDMSRGLCNTWLSPTEATEVKFRSDVTYDYTGMSGECTHNGTAYPIEVRPDHDGLWVGRVPAIKGAKDRESVTITMRAEREGQPPLVKEWAMVVRHASKPRGGRRKRKTENVETLDDVPGPADNIRIKVVDSEEAFANLVVTKNDIIGIDMDSEGFYGIINKLAPAMVKAARALTREISKAKGSERHRLYKQESLIDYELGGILTETIRQAIKDAKSDGKKPSADRLCGDELRGHLNAAAVNHGFFTDIDPATEAINRRYEG